jgi:glycyl-tRNA synthetase beta chain
VKVTPSTLLAEACRGYGDDKANAAWADLQAFVRERLETVLVMRGYDKANVRSVLAARAGEAGIGVRDLANNLEALAEFSRSAPFRQLATAFKRVRNIARELKDEAPDAEWRKQLREPAELELLAQMDAGRKHIDEAARTGTGFNAAYTAMANIEPAVARFFNDVFVMADDAALRRARLQLMRELEQLILQLGDISEIVSLES